MGHGHDPITDAVPPMPFRSRSSGPVVGKFTDPKGPEGCCLLAHPTAPSGPNDPCGTNGKMRPDRRQPAGMCRRAIPRFQGRGRDANGKAEGLWLGAMLTASHSTGHSQNHIAPRAYRTDADPITAPTGSFRARPRCDHKSMRALTPSGCYPIPSPWSGKMSPEDSSPPQKDVSRHIRLYFPGTSCRELQFPTAKPLMSQSHVAAAAAPGKGAPTPRCAQGRRRYR
jgi:hypothetical protein